MNIKYLLIIVAISAAIYANTLNNAFVSDDIPAIVENPHISNLFYRLAVPNIINAIDYKIGGLNPFVYHISSIIIHALASIMAFFFLRLFFRPQASFWGALIFAVHPVNAEAVTWISGRPYALFTVFLLGSYFLHRRAAEAKFKIWSYLGSVSLFFISFYTNTFAFVFPVLIVLSDITFGGWRKRWKLWPAFFGVELYQFLITISPASHRAEQLSFETGSSALSNPIFNMAHSVFSGLWLLLWPEKLTLYHEPVVVSPFQLGIEIFLLVSLFLAMPFIFKRARPLFFGAAIFILFLAPTYSPVMISWLVAERYLYFPSLAFAMVVAFIVERTGVSGVKEGSNKRKRGVGKGKRPADREMAGPGKINKWVTAGLVILVAAYSARTIVRNMDWKSHASIWRSTVRVSPLSAKAHNNMGDVYSLEGDLQKAAQEFIRATELNPRCADAYHNLANTYEKMGEMDKAFLNYKKATSENPRLWQSYAGLARIYFKRGEGAQAREYLNKAAELKGNAKY